MQNCIHLLSDRHLDSPGPRQSDGGLGGENAFRDRAVHAGDDLRQLAPAAQFDAYAPVAGESAGAGENQIPQAGQPGHGFLDGRRRPRPAA